MYRNTVWRGTYGDVLPVEVAKDYATLPDGTLRPGHFETEMQAWGAVMAEHEEAVECGIARQQKALADYATARGDLQQRRDQRTKASANFEAWRRACKERGAAV